MIIDKILTKEKEINLTAGEQQRDFIFVEDVAKIFKKLI
ncbi:MAG: NAD-dependent epimerase/dehydratase family protein [Candidatus Peribacteria bacterium]|jgi:nucleoside-diphosphate-sugar epimerase|nr:NAD-dependent epimerase/dehydratase family protein [Candidatus Peribacteria bacterium]